MNCRREGATGRSLPLVEPKPPLVGLGWCSGDVGHRVAGMMTTRLRAAVVLATLSIGTVPTLAAAQFRVPPRTGALTVDGRITDAEWTGAERLTLDHQVLPGDNVPPSEQTTVMMAHDADHLYLAIRARDSDAAGIRGRVVRRDDLSSEDSITVHLDTFNDRRRAYVFIVNPLGIQGDGLYTEGTTIGRDFAGNVDATWDGVWRSAGRITDDGYEVEIAIPFRTLRFGGGATRTWGLHVQRWIARKAERVSWQPQSREATSLLTQMGALTGLDTIRVQRPLDLLPSVTASAVTAPGASGSATTRSSDPGLTATWQVTPNAAVSAAINPDFSQVEADVPQIEVNQRFPLFYAEKRPFFLEGGQYFRSPGALTFVNTRQIVDPDWGIRAAGKRGSDTVAALSARDRGGAHFNIARYQRDLGANSTLGTFLTERRDAGAINRVLAIDGQVRFSKQTIGFQGGRSTTETLGGEATHGTATYVWYDFAGRHWRLFLNDQHVSAGYRTSAGFARQTGFRSNSAHFSREWQALRSTWWVTARPFLVTAYARTLTGRTDGTYIDPGVDVSFARNIELYTYVSRRRDYFGGRTLDGLTYYGSLDVGAWKTVVPGASVRVGRSAVFDPVRPTVGPSHDISLRATLAPNDRLNQTLSYQHLRVEDPNWGQTLVEQRLFRSRTNVQLTRFHALRAIVEFNTRSRQLGLSGLYSFTPRPNTSVYLGYSDLLTDLGVNPRGHTRDGFDRLQRTLFVKVAFGWRVE